MVYITGQKESGTVIFVKTEDCQKPRDCDSVIDIFRERGFKKIAAWAVPPSDTNIYFVDMYGANQKCEEVELDVFLQPLTEKGNPMEPTEENVVDQPEQEKAPQLNEMLSKAFTDALIHDLNTEENLKVPIENGGQFVRASTVVEVFIEDDGKRNIRVVEQHVESVVPAPEPEPLPEDWDDEYPEEEGKENDE